MITRIKGDMLDQDPAVADNSVDLLLTDPPYNISAEGAMPVWIDKNTGEDKSSIHKQKFSKDFDQDWDNIGHEEFLEQLSAWSNFWFRKLRKGGTFGVFISDQYISYLWKIMELEGFEPKRVWTWKKPAAVPFNRKVLPTSACEYLLFGVKPGGKRTFNSDAAEGSMIERYALADKISSIVYKLVKDSDECNLDRIMQEAKKEAQAMMQARKRNGDIIECVIPNTITYSGGLGKSKIHPTQKPTEILEYFINLLSNEGDLVLDTFAGSGSTGIACEKLKRNCILIEKDSSMFDKMDKRFQSSNLFE